eukprot:m.172348 g.172348  ORF g.172348 m.172348 type:complete len:313 (+) comp9945_c0_seq5:1554-2492(+)
MQSGSSLKRRWRRCSSACMYLGTCRLSFRSPSLASPTSTRTSSASATTSRPTCACGAACWRPPGRAGPRTACRSTRRAWLRRAPAYVSGVRPLRPQELPLILLERTIEDADSMLRTGYRVRRCRDLKRFLLEGVRMLAQVPLGTVNTAKMEEGAATAVEWIIRLSNTEFERTVRGTGRPAVAAHYEEILRAVNELKNLTKRIAESKRGTMGHVSAATRLTQLLQESIRNVLYDACRLLMEHIVEVSQPQLSDLAMAAASPRDLVLWLMFGCKFTNNILELFGPDHLDGDGKFHELLHMLQSLEVALPAESSV